MHINKQYVNNKQLCFWRVSYGALCMICDIINGIIRQVCDFKVELKKKKILPLSIFEKKKEQKKDGVRNCLHKLSDKYSPNGKCIAI